MKLFGLILLPLFFISLYFIFKVTFGEEGKDERGQKILSKSYMLSAPILPIGWLILEVTHTFSSISYDIYRDTIWTLILLTFIIQGLAIYIYKRII